MNDDLATVMTSLSEPPAPASLKATVMARIAREAEDRQSVLPAPARSYGDRFVWLSAFAGLAVVICAVAYGRISGGTLPNLTSPMIGPVSIPVIPQGPAALVIGLGLLVYLAGLFGPLRTDSRK